MSDNSNATKANSGIFKSLRLPPESKEPKPGELVERTNSSRMDEALRLRESLQGSSSSYLKRRQLINELASPRAKQDKQFEDLDEAEYDEDFDVASFRGKFGENLEPNAGVSSKRAAIFARLDMKVPSTPRSQAAEKSVSSQVFKDQLSARFKSKMQAKKLASADSNEGAEE